MTALADIGFDTPELVALHEAGHVSVAMALGARVEEVVLYRHPVRAYARTRVQRTLAQSLPIAAAGLAVEIQLYVDGRLRLSDGTAPSEKAFIDYAVGSNAADDKVRFFGEDRSINGIWSSKDDDHFISFAQQIRRLLNWPEIERIAKALLQYDRLDEGTIHPLDANYGPCSHNTPPGDQ